MSATKRRKVAIESTRIAPSLTARGIAGFAKVTKSQAISKFIQAKTFAIETSVDSQLLSGALERRRKTPAVQNIELDQEEAQAEALVSATINSSRQEVNGTIRKQITLHDKSIQTPKARDAGPTSPTESYSKSQYGELPKDVVDLFHLHSSFLTALSLHYAHNGTRAPVDLRGLCLDISKVWGRRKVQIYDVRRILAILKTGSLAEDEKSRESLTDLRLSDYGQGKICVENETLLEKNGRIAPPLDENHMNDRFIRNLRRLWNERTDRAAQSVKQFLDSLPLEPITICSSFAKISPLLAKGQQRLEDMKNGITIRQDTEKPKINNTRLKEKGRANLLERLRAKELQKSMLPSPPSKEELDRKAALTRLDEVAAVLTLLSTSTSSGQARVSFTMSTALAKLKDSFKIPLSSQEAEVCIRLLATEIAPEWLKIVKMGKLEAVIAERENRPSETCIQERAKRAA